MTLALTNCPGHNVPFPPSCLLIALTVITIRPGVRSSRYCLVFGHQFYGNVFLSSCCNAAFPLSLYGSDLLYGAARVFSCHLSVRAPVVMFCIMMSSVRHPAVIFQHSFPFFGLSDRKFRLSKLHHRLLVATLWPDSKRCTDSSSFRYSAEVGTLPSYRFLMGFPEVKFRHMFSVVGWSKSSCYCTDS